MFVSLMGARTVDETFQIVLRSAKSLLGFDRARVLLVDEQTNELVTRAAIGLTRAEEAWVGSVGNAAPGLVAETGEARFVSDARGDREKIGLKKPVGSELAVPLTTKDGTIGVLDVFAKKTNAFTAANQCLLSTVGLQAAAAISAKMVEEQRDLLSAVTRMLANEPGTFESRLQKVVALIPAALHAGACSLFLEDADGKRLVLAATTGMEPGHSGPVDYGPGEGITGWIWSSVEPLRIVSLADSDELSRISPDLKWSNKFSETLDTKAARKQYLGVPLVVSGRCNGVLRVSRKLDGTNFTSDDQRLMTTIAQELAVAVSVRNFRPTTRRRSARKLMAADLFAVAGKRSGGKHRAIKEFEVQRYCTLLGGVCTHRVRVHDKPSAFLAYPFNSNYESLMKRVKQGLKRKGYEAVLPMDSDSTMPDQGVLFCKLCRKILGTDMILAETTDLNRNVLFEIGYALGASRGAYSLVSNSRVKPRELPLTRDLERIFYDNSRDILEHFGDAAQVTEQDLSRGSSELTRILSNWNRGFRANTAYCLMPADKYHVTDTREILSDALDGLGIEEIQCESLSHKFYAECGAINEAEFVIGDWVGDDIEDAEGKNAGVAFLLGLTMALGKKIIILQQTPVAKRMIDMSGVIAEYQQDEEIAAILQKKLGSDSFRQNVRPEDDAVSLVKREFTTYRIHGRLMSKESFDFVYENQQFLSLSAAEQQFLELCANHHAYPKWGYRQVELDLEL